MPRKKRTRSTSAQKEKSPSIPVGAQTSGGSPEEVTFSDYPDSFFTDGKVKSLQGTSNVIIVAPNMSPNTDDKNIGILTCWLAEALGAYAVINCRRYRRPKDGDPPPEELQPSDSPSRNEKDKDILKLRQRFLEETGGIPVNLDSYGSASIAAYEYVEAIWLAAGEIGYKDIPLAFFVYGVDDAVADKHAVDGAIGIGYVSDQEEEIYTRDTVSAARAYVGEFIRRLSLRRRIQIEGVSEHSLTSDDVAGWLRYNWNDRFQPSMADGWRAEDVYSILLAFRYTGFRDSKENLKYTVRKLTEAISGLSLFRSWKEGEVAKPEEKKTKKVKAEKEKTPQEQTPPVSEQPSRGGDREAMKEEVSEPAQSGVVLISQEKFQEKVRALRGLTTIRNDKDVDVAFEGEAKEVFVNAFEAAYPVMQTAFASIHELGTFLTGVKEKLKPHKLYYRWLEHTGIPQRTAANYTQIHERYADRLPQFAHLGIRKLLTASRLKDCVDYVEQNEEVIAEQSTAELEQAVKDLRSTKKTTGKARGPKPTYEQLGKYRIRPSSDGTRVVVEGLSKKQQAEVIEAIRAVLS